ncbi:hypothetical protein [Bradyrhizobium sp. B120]|uniref:hypothetical protein n=1 Tax=Bradyrhizobium sp. B120 TaxID=3410088 RepID=UPI003B97FBDA
MLLAKKRVHLRKRLTPSATLTELACQDARIIEMRIIETPEAAIAVNQHRQFGRIDDALDHVNEFAP